ncbi:MAG: ribosome silencing factor [Butyribacter sp.]|nr:ribosome silencing factor [bacterium]MDY3853863.1 ribosome silencing factor [Butyribacter sp.]
MKESTKMAQIAYKALDEKIGEDIKIIDIAGISILADYFVIANGSSLTQVQALVKNVQEQMHRAGYEMKREEGNRNSTWVLLDYGDVVVHIFDQEDRLFYDLERIWSDGKEVSLDEIAQEK